MTALVQPCHIKPAANGIIYSAGTPDGSTTFSSSAGCWMWFSRHLRCSCI
jgi:hypothetical protein